MSKLNIRNVAIIAHVDHGKTTIVDGLLKQSNMFRDNQSEMGAELLMDSGDQEKERGITITAKITAVERGDLRINIIDTPGHADFSGEVERTLNMADGCLLIIDAQEGPMPQTKFVLGKALEHGLKPVVVINKIDKPGRRIAEVEDEIGDLFLELATDDDQLLYPIFYAIGRDGKAWSEVPENPDEDANFDVLFEAIEKEIPAPSVDKDGPFQMQVTALAWDSFKGKYSIGRITRGSIKKGDQVVICHQDDQPAPAKVDGVYMSHGLSKFEVEDGGQAGDIVQLTGIAKASIGDTLTDPATPDKLPDLEIEAPTLQIYLGPNTSPLKGQEGKFTTGRQIGERLDKEKETNVGLLVEPDAIGFKVSGRGELHLSVLIEAMRREGFEFEVGRPEVVTHIEDGVEVEPVEELNIEVPDEYVGAVQQELGTRRATLKSQEASAKGGTLLVYEIATRNIIGLRGIMLTATKGTIIMNSSTTGFQPKGAKLKQTRNGVLVAIEQGTTTPYSLQNIEARGTCFVPPGVIVYQGMIVGLNSRSEDMEINPTKAKQLTNMRTSGSDGVVQLTPPVIFTLEEAMDFIEDDELLEVTPESLRLRKRYLNPSERKKNKNKK